MTLFKKFYLRVYQETMEISHFLGTILEQNCRAMKIIFTAHFEKHYISQNDEHIFWIERQIDTIDDRDHLQKPVQIFLIANFALSAKIFKRTFEGGPCGLQCHGPEKCARHFGFHNVFLECAGKVVLMTLEFCSRIVSKKTNFYFSDFLFEFECGVKLTNLKSQFWTSMVFYLIQECGFAIPEKLGFPVFEIIL